MILALLLQITPVQPMPKGTALPPPGTEEAQVMAPVATILASIATRDIARITAQLLPGGTATVAVERPDGTRTIRRLTFDQWTAAIGSGTDPIAETQGMPAIEVDGDMAMVWAPYSFTIGGKVAHCGTNHYSLVRDAGTWKIASLAWTQRTTGCTPA